MQNQVIKRITQTLSKNLKNKNLSKIPRQPFCFEKHHLPFDESEYNYVYSPAPSQGLSKLETFRVIDLEGNLKAPEYENIPSDILNKIYQTMLKVEQMDIILNMSQRQGKISFYMPSFGELATTVATSAALNSEDLIFSQYREQGALIWRGYTFEQVLHQCMGTQKDLGKGRQMPVHYGSKELNWVTVSSPLTTQVPQASGAGYAFRCSGEDRLAVTYFGEGAASEGDFHSALNFAATLETQTLFLCRNNKWAISTPTVDQYRGDGISGKSIGYGIQTYRVDGNDALAVYNVVKEAREYIIREKKPAFIEYMTYRIGDHSTSDHSVLYRSEEEINSWKNSNNPILRLQQYLIRSGKKETTQEQDEQLQKDAKNEVIKCLKEASNEKFHYWESLFEDVYDELTPNLVEQQEQLRQHLNIHGDKYNLDKLIQKP